LPPWRFKYQPGGGPQGPGAGAGVTAQLTAQELLPSPGQVEISLPAVPLTHEDDACSGVGDRERRLDPGPEVARPLPPMLAMTLAQTQPQALEFDC
jgi:hypothetical protein